MNVSGIRPYEGFYSYNSIKINELRNQQIVAAQQAQAQANQNTEVESKENTAQVFLADEKVINQTYTAFEFAQEYRPDEVYELKGADSDINMLDIKKAVSDLEKDAVLQQYQYFVGEKNQGVMQKASTPVEQTTLRSGENFFL